MQEFVRIKHTSLIYRMELLNNKIAIHNIIFRKENVYIIVKRIINYLIENVN